MTSASIPKQIDVENWDRKEVYAFFKDFKDPFFGFTVECDVTRLYTFCKDQGFSFSAVYLYCSQVVVNSIPELRYRLKNGQVWDFPSISAGTTVLKDNKVFTFCYLEHINDLRAFVKHANERITASKHPDTPLEDHDDELAQIYYSVIPWIHFTGLVHPSNHSPEDSCPRITFGKMVEDRGVRKMPISVEAHHALLDGYHLGIYYKRLQNHFDHPESLLER